MTNDEIDIFNGMFALGLVDVAISLDDKDAQYLFFMKEHAVYTSLWYRYRERKPFRIVTEDM
jgi:hypothetical protein